MAPRRDRAESLSLWSSEYPVNDFALDQRAEERYILGRLEKFEEPGASPPQSDCCFTNHQATPMRRAFGFRQIFPAQYVLYCRDVKPKKHQEQWHLF
jgi:hypothetical protein